MSRIDDLIAEACPNGVEFRPLGEVVIIKNGSDHKKLSEGDVPVYGSGGVMRHVDTAMAVGPSVLIPRKGSLGNIFYVEGEFWVVDTIFRTEVDEEVLFPKFLYHQLLTMGLGEMNQAGGVPSQTQTALKKLRIPVPPMEVQREIVRILDQFIDLEADLEAELEARCAQYEGYRRQLLKIGDANSGRTLPMGEIFEMRAGTHIKAAEISDEQTEGKPYPCYGGNGLRGFVGSYNYDESVILVGRQGALCGNVHRAEGKIYATEHAVVVTPKLLIDMSWAFHKLIEMDLNQYKTKSAQPGLSVGRLKQVEVQYAPVDEQRRDGEVLDKLATLANDIGIGLPAEIAARRKQYAYYRDKLLSFKEAV